MRAAAADLDFEEAARLRDEIKRLRATELAVLDDPTAKAVAISRSSLSPRLRGEGRGEGGSPSARARGESPSPASLRSASSPRTRGEGPRKPTLDEMGPGPDKESKPYRPGPRSTTGRPGMRGGWRPRGR
jgi:excinuclease ABC subunit B